MGRSRRSKVRKIVLIQKILVLIDSFKQNIFHFRIFHPRYLPSAWRSNNVEQLPDQGKEEINKVNRDLVAKLKLTDSAFSLGTYFLFKSN